MRWLHWSCASPRLQKARLQLLLDQNARGSDPFLQLSYNPAAAVTAPQGSALQDLALLAPILFGALSFGLQIHQQHLVPPKRPRPRSATDAVGHLETAWSGCLGRPGMVSTGWNLFRSSELSPRECAVDADVRHTLPVSFKKEPRDEFSPFSARRRLLLVTYTGSCRALTDAECTADGSGYQPRRSSVADRSISISRGSASRPTADDWAHKPGVVGMNNVSALRAVGNGVWRGTTSNGSTNVSAIVDVKGKVVAKQQPDNG